MTFATPADAVGTVSAAAATPGEGQDSRRLARETRPTGRRDAAAARPKFAPIPTEAGVAFKTFADALREEFAPNSSLENVVVDRLILAAWRLRRIADREAEAAARLAEGRALPAMTREALRAESSLDNALNTLRIVRQEQERARPHTWGQPATVDSKSIGAAFVAPLPYEVHDHEAGHFAYISGADLSNEWPTLPNVIDDEDFDADTSVDDHLLWRDRLVMDANVSPDSPVVKGTWVTARHVVSLIVDGWAWSDVLRDHPELNEADVRACLAYTVCRDSGEDV